jgi:hypothetical protein
LHKRTHQQGASHAAIKIQLDGILAEGIAPLKWGDYLPEIFEH